MTQPDIPPKSGGDLTGTEPKSASQGEVQVKLFARTDVGQIREHNEDNFLVADLTRRSRGLLEANRTSIVGPQGSLFVVCDGMGGAAAGEIASQLAVDIVYEKMIEAIDDNAPPARNELARRLVRAVESAGLRIYQEAKLDRSRRGMGTTVTAAALLDSYLFLAQVGDSRGYVLRDGNLIQVTRDQSLVNQLIEAGQLTEEEAETFEHNNIILQALGTADTVQVDLTFVELRQGDVLLLCSDGLSGMVRFDEIREVLRTTPEPLDACKLLTERANQAGGHDNITVIVVRFDGEGLKPMSTGGGSGGDESEQLKYRKYPLPEQGYERSPSSSRNPTAGDLAPTLGPPANLYSPPPANRGDSEGSRAPQGLSNTQIFSSSPVVLPAGAGAAQWPGGPGAGAQMDFEERIDIPGTHVPAWVVVALVVGVVVMLGGTAFLLLR